MSIDGRVIAAIVILALVFMFRGEIMERVGGFSLSGNSSEGSGWAPASVAGQGYLNDLNARQARQDARRAAARSAR